jgi:hypothetical protein
MKTGLRVTLATLLLSLGACVTINVYFPEAEAREAAEQFVEDVLGEPEAPAPGEGQRQKLQAGAGWSFDPLSLLIGTAHAQESVDVRIDTPAIRAIQERMAGRFQNQLQPHFDSGALGFGNDGLVVLRDATKLPLRDRVGVQELVAEDNRDRRAVYREIAVANGHPEWEARIRTIFAEEWIANARRGWWYQAGDGSWRQK